MNGKRILLDTNAVVAFLQNNQQVLNYTRSIEWLGISIISQIEFLSFSRLSAEDRELFGKFAERIHVIDLRSDYKPLIDLVAEIRRDARVKLPDAIIAATALQYDASVVTADRRLSAITRLTILAFNP